METGNDPTEKALDAELVEDAPVFRFGRRGHPDAIVEAGVAGVGIPARDGVRQRVPKRERIVFQERVSPFARSRGSMFERRK